MIKYVISGIAIVALIVVGPVAMIWGLNTLFSLAIPYTWKTWLACCVVFGSLYGPKFKA